MARQAITVSMLLLGRDCAGAETVLAPRLCWRQDSGRPSQDIRTGYARLKARTQPAFDTLD